MGRRIGGIGVQVARRPKYVLDVDVHVARRIQKLRLLRGITQEQIADELKLSFQQVQKYEKGLNRISAGRLYQLAQFLSVEVAYFYEGLNGKAPDPVGSMSADAIRIAKSFDAIQDERARRMVMAVVAAAGAR
jgi:transcriptional regulator with XRE-family HTH domain